MGLGRAQLEQSIVEAETATRRQLDVEQQMQETEMQRQQRMQRAEEREMVVKQVADMNRTFYCEVRTYYLCFVVSIEACCKASGSAHSESLVLFIPHGR